MYVSFQTLGKRNGYGMENHMCCIAYTNDSVPVRCFAIICIKRKKNIFVSMEIGSLYTSFVYNKSNNRVKLKRAPDKW